MTAGEIGLILAPVGIAIGSGGWKIGAGLVELSRIVDKLGIEVSAMHDRIVKVETVIERIAPPTIRWNEQPPGMPHTGN